MITKKQSYQNKQHKSQIFLSKFKHTTKTYIELKLFISIHWISASAKTILQTPFYHVIVVTSILKQPPPISCDPAYLFTELNWSAAVLICGGHTYMTDAHIPQPLTGCRMQNFFKNPKETILSYRIPFAHAKRAEIQRKTEEPKDENHNQQALALTLEGS